MLGKFFTTVAVGSLFVGGLAATHLAYAQPGAEGGRRGGLMAMADTNKDGKISKAELTAALDARFARMDADKDGQITQKDRDAMRQQRQDARFVALDTDKNGQISKAEFAAAHQARADRRAELRGPGGPDAPGRGGRFHHGPGRGGMMGHGGFGGMGEANKDGVITKAEFTAGATAMFDRADTDKDGFVTADEMKAARQAMRGAWRKAPPQN
ncbi:EF-hand domain-containing protein [Sphingobium sp. HBC34]|uniref:EF-hand domain-containing protein n=1 Tax=Sphingobium cyanobacteriorum TaxID=3063954 RepID=A0ABT8ZNA3_9SPHN|nr:EF-hand domain-containing protein [Sphingobium sp. HBC34]MDO7835672.1 EF-hand domain-containing protein [Sphingobium sp. HBC34]